MVIFEVCCIHRKKKLGCYHAAETCLGVLKTSVLLAFYGQNLVNSHVSHES